MCLPPTSSEAPFRPWVIWPSPKSSPPDWAEVIPSGPTSLPLKEVLGCGECKTQTLNARLLGVPGDTEISAPGPPEAARTAFKNPARKDFVSILQIETCQRGLPGGGDAEA